MDRQMKSPYIPPKDKIISDMEIKKLESLNKIVLDEIKVILAAACFLHGLRCQPACGRRFYWKGVASTLGLTALSFARSARAV